MRRFVGLFALTLVLSCCAGSDATSTAGTTSGTAATTTDAQIAAPTSAPIAVAVETVTIDAAAGATEIPAETEAVTAATADSSTTETAASTTAATVGAAAQPTAAGTAAPAVPGQTLQAVRDRDSLICGVNDTLPGFGNVDSSGNFTGFDVDFCKAIAAAVLGDPNKVQYRPVSSQERFAAVQSGEIDVLIRNTTWTASREGSLGLDFAPTTFYDGQGMMVRASDNITSLEDMDGATVCVQSGSTTEQNLADAFRAINAEFEPAVFEENNQVAAAYDEGRCDGFTADKSALAATRLQLQNPDDNIILDVTMSKEPLAPSVLQGDPQWAHIVDWVVYATITAEELEITSANIDTFSSSEDPNIRRFIGVEGELGAGFGLANDWTVTVIKAVGNYDEIYNRHLGPDTDLNIPRGQNALYTQGGLLYAPPFR